MDINQCVNEIEIILKSSIYNQTQYINWFKNQNILIKLEIFKEKRNQFFKLKGSDIDKELLDYISFIKSIEKFYNQERYLKKKNKNMSLENLKTISNLEIKKIKRPRKKVKYEQVLNRWSTVERMRQENVSWRDIERLFSSKYRIDISHQWLRQIFKSVNGE